MDLSTALNENAVMKTNLIVGRRGKLGGGGRVMTSQGTFTGRWLAADCGRRD
jgi:hypothetical protein